jgi:hypothetical protein
LNSTNTNIKGGTKIELESSQIYIASSGIGSSSRFVVIGSNNVGSNTDLQAGGELKSLSIHRFNNPLKLSYTPDNIVAGQLGFVITYAGSATFTYSDIDTPTSIASLSLTAGVWLLKGGSSGYQNGVYSHQSFSPTVSLGTPSFTNSYNFDIAITSFISLTTTTKKNLIVQTGVVRSLGSINMSAVRIA